MRPKPKVSIVEKIPTTRDAVKTVATKEMAKTKVQRAIIEKIENAEEEVEEKADDVETRTGTQLRPSPTVIRRKGFLVNLMVQTKPIGLQGINQIAGQPTLK